MLRVRGLLFLLLLLPLIHGFWDKGGGDGGYGGGGGGKGKGGGGGKGSGTACTVKGSYCQVDFVKEMRNLLKLTFDVLQCHYCKCESGYLNCGYSHGHGHGG